MYDNNNAIGPDYREIERSEWRRRDNLSRATSASITLMIIVFAVRDAYFGNTQMALTMATFGGVNVIAMALYERVRALEIFGYFLTLSCGLLCLYLVATGGNQNAGILWLSCYPVLMFSILSVRVALISTLSVLVLTALLVFVPGNAFFSAEYNIYHKISAIGSYVLITGFTFYQARAREKSTYAVSRLNRELSYIASTDELTQLPNRRDMTLRLEFESRRAKRTGEAFSIILCDIDYFKKINDSFGHSVGDQALQAFSTLLQSRFRKTDKVGRWGGEEFLAILPNTSLDQAITLADEVRTSICQASLFPNMPNRLVTMSAGVACSRQTLDPGELVSLADALLYEAKNSGRNRVRPQLNETE